MEDYTHLRKAGGKDDEREALLAGQQHSPTEAKECLDEMKKISALIADVRLKTNHESFNLLYYIGRHYILKIRVSFLGRIHLRLCSTIGFHC
jgi:hypothetical protein